MNRRTRKSRIARPESLEPRLCLASVGWDGPGQGSAALTYYLGEAPSYLDSTEVETAIELALQAWSDVADVTFTKTLVPNRLDSIDIEFTSIDGPGGTLALAYLPDDVNPARIGVRTARLE